VKRAMKRRGGVRVWAFAPNGAAIAVPASAWRRERRERFVRMGNS
jgi:hypothetical protein